MDFGVLGSVKSLEVSRLVDGDVSVDCHEDDDVDRARHERVDQRQLEMGLVEGGGVAGVVQAGGDVVEGGDGGHQDAEVGHGQTQQVHVHHSYKKGRNSE